ncbi:hypothetical protein HDV04_001746 [Boothiomyces sp. JEL0838]|nr:hypothetical protein HDV04_001746 [Boothiomyces sp. JEL0838]
MLPEQRTLYFGNLPPITLPQFLDNIRGGKIESCKYIEEKCCIFITFVSAQDALNIFNYYKQKRFELNGNLIRVGYGKPTAPNMYLEPFIQKGATRNVFIGNIGNVTVQWLYNEISQYGEIDLVEIRDKGIAFVHMTSIMQAIHVVNSLADDPKWKHCRIYYGQDRCQTTIPNLTFDERETNRTIYIGAMHPDTTAKDLCDNIRGGILQQLKYFKEKSMAFVTFVDAHSAHTFYNLNKDGLVIKTKRVKIGWGKPTMLPPALYFAIQNGASRNVYIGNINETITVEKLYRDFECFGEIEMINIVPDKGIAFVNFMDISSAIKAVESINGYDRFRISFGKDRCGNPPKQKDFISPPITPIPDDFK